MPAVIYFDYVLVKVRNVKLNLSSSDTSRHQSVSNGKVFHSFSSARVTGTPLRVNHTGPVRLERTPQGKRGRSGPPPSQGRRGLFPVG